MTAVSTLSRQIKARPGDPEPCGPSKGTRIRIEKDADEVEHVVEETEGTTSNKSVLKV